MCLAVGVAVLGAAGSEPAGYAPRIDPAAFTGAVVNPCLPLRPGSRRVYEGRTDEGPERIVVEVTDDIRVVMGVPCVVVWDTVTRGGHIYEETFDWFAEDRDGNVWYFGEETRKRTADGGFTPEGSWEAGVRGPCRESSCRPVPAPGAPYRQEYLPGQAEDMAMVLRTGELVDARVERCDGFGCGHASSSAGST